MSENPLVRLRRSLHTRIVVNAVRVYYNRVWGTNIGKGSRISSSVKMDKANPAGIVVGENTAITFGVSIVTHDYINNFHTTTTIGSNCFIGAYAIIMPGVKVGDHCIVGAGSVVMRDVPANSVVMGNPARVIERDIRTGPYGKRFGIPQVNRSVAGTPALEPETPGHLIPAVA